MEKNTIKKSARRWFEGEVVNVAGNKTVKVMVTMTKLNKKYKKRFKVVKKFLAHDEHMKAKPGDFVKIVECRPISKIKRWRILEIKIANNKV